jgi:hypothetical protein
MTYLSLEKIFCFLTLVVLKGDFAFSIVRITYKWQAGYKITLRCYKEIHRSYISAEKSFRLLNLEKQSLFGG